MSETADHPPQGRALLPEELFSELLRHRAPHTAASEALSSITERFGAEIGSVFYAAHPPVHVRWGESSEAMSDYLDRWEARTAQRITESPWLAEDPARPQLTWQIVDGLNRIAVHSLIVEKNRVAGAISLAFLSESLPSDHDLTAMSVWLRAVGNAISLISELALSRQRLSQLSLFYQLAQATASTIDLEQILDDTLELISAILDASASALMLIDEEARELVVAHAHGEMVPLLGRRTGLDEGLAGRVATRGEPALTNDALQGPQFGEGAGIHPEWHCQSAVCVPVRVRGKIIAALLACNKRDGAGFDAEDLSLMVTTANQAAAAIQNSQVYEDLRAEQDRIIQAQENVRRQVARNLHDGTVQFLSAISMNIDHLERLLEIKPEAVKSELHALRDLARQATQQARLALFELRPLVLETQGLGPTLEMYVQQLEASEPFAIHLQAPDALPDLANAVSATVFAIIQEAVTNAKKHASPDDVWLRLSLEPECLCVVVEDNGKGFDYMAIEQTYDLMGSIGLLSMKERAGLISGKVEIQSSMTAPHAGTKVTLRVPISTTRDSELARD